MQLGFRGLSLSAAVLLLIGLTTPAFSTSNTVEVGTCVPGLLQFQTIQSAVDQSPAGSTIEVCPGNYPEEVSISKNMTLRGIANPNSNPVQDAAVVVSPSTGVVQNTTSFSSNQPIAAQILVGNGASVTISSMTVDGSNNKLSDCSVNLVGIMYQNASGTVSTSVMRNQALAPSLSGCQDGLGFFAQSGQGGTSNVTVQESSVHNYDKNGITGNETGTTLKATNNVVQGAGVVAPPGSAQNGIQIGFGAKGTVSGNTVLDQVYGDPATAASIGVLLYDTAENSVTVTSNKISNTQGGVGIYTDGANPTQDGDGATVQSNNIFETSAYDGIDVCTNGNTIKGNTIANSAESAIHLDASCTANGNNTGDNNTVSGNIMLESACAGILEDSGTFNTIGSGNVFLDIPYTIVTGTCPGGSGARLGKAVHGHPVR